LSEGVRGFTDKLKRVITSPRESFEGIDERDLRKGFAVVLLVAVLSAWAGMVYMPKMDFSLLGTGRVQLEGSGLFFSPGVQNPQEFDPSAMMSRLMPFIAIGNVVGSVLRWLVPSALLLLSAKVLVGEGSSRRLLAMTGFASFPKVFQQALRVVDAYMITSQELTALIASRAAPTDLPGRILIQALNLIDVFSVTTIALTVFAVSTNYGTPTRRALTVTILAYAAYVLIRTLIPIV
jgi:hypothetical protein